jgi:broad specificity phosphatase PhoE
MPTYPVINLKTKETKELNMSMKAYDEWKKENPDWDKDWSQGCASTQEMFRWTGEAASSGWNEVLDRASKQPGANVRKNRDYSF